jgi:NAD(P)-dependent dehydrogenase (short-subunit alcohol dehydrogenase family)
VTPRTILITGCSTGIGRAAALQLHDRGHTVCATARDVDDLQALADEGMTTLPLDVTDERSMQEAVRTVIDRHSRLDVLVNNAGYALQGTIEQTPMSDVRQQFETNVFGAMRMVQLVVPSMREQRSGRIITLGSMGGRIVLPGGGYYHATKHALEALSDALRLEVAPFGIDVVLVQPGAVRSAFVDTALDTVGPGAFDPDDPYGTFMTQVTQTYLHNYRAGAPLAMDPHDVAATIVKAVGATHPRARYAVGLQARALMNGRRLLPDIAWDAMVRRSYPTPEG